MIVCVPVHTDGTVDPRWGRADRVAIADVEAGRITDWHEFEVLWGQLHDDGPEGAHHARIVRFLREHEVEAVVASHMGPPMAHTLGKMGLQLHLGATGNARQTVEAAAASL